MSFEHSSRRKLTYRDLDRFGGTTLFDRIGRVLCEAACVPRKELYESWEVARRAYRRFKGGRIVDLACGHGLLAHILLVLDDRSPGARAIDVKLPPSARSVNEAMTRAFPQLADRVVLEEKQIAAVELERDDVVVSAHACGPLTDQVLSLAASVHARVAVLPCCHSLAKCDLGGLEGWLDGPTAIDATRAARMRELGYKVITQRIAPGITPQDRLLIAIPEW